MKKVLSLKDISFSYPKQSAILTKISFNIEAGELLGVVGPNGAGKSTLLKIICGLLIPDKGELKKASSIAYIPQNHKLNYTFPFSLKDIIALGNPSLTDTKAKELLKTVELNKSIHDLGKNLSGGEQQRLLIAKALARDPQLLVLDEATAGLDAKGLDLFQEILTKLKAKMAIIIVDHNIEHIIRHSDKILCLGNHFHWHDKKDALSKDILEQTYHCEFEHLLIHEKEGSSSEHIHCHDGSHIKGDHNHD